MSRMIMTCIVHVYIMYIKVMVSFILCTFAERKANSTGLWQVIYESYMSITLLMYIKLLVIIVKSDKKILSVCVNKRTINTLRKW